MIFAPKNGLILATLITAMVLTLVPLPEVINPFRPDWMAMTVLFWVLRIPRYFNLGTAWIIGITMDLTLGTLFGQHALALIIFAYLGILFDQQYRAMSIALQVVMVAAMLALYRTLLLWVWGMGQDHDITASDWMSLLTSALTWPWYAQLLAMLDTRTRRNIGAED